MEKDSESGRSADASPSKFIVSYAHGLNSDPCHKVFLASIKQHVPDAEFVNTKPSTAPGQIVHTRWQPILEVLNDLPDQSRVFLLDARDTVLNSDPFQLMEGKGDLVFFSEGQNTSEHPWCVTQHCLYAKHQRVKPAASMKTPEVNGGCIYGTAEKLRIVAAFMAGKARELATTKISDQPVLNQWCREHNHRPLSNPAIYAHGELVKQKRWKSDPMKAAIYHQFDRVPLHKAHYITPFALSPSIVHRVISRYNEKPGGWNMFFPESDSTVYCKGPNPLPGEIVLENVGYEAHTWLHHFYENYNDLPPITLCLQGDPAPHCRVDHSTVMQKLRFSNPDTFWFMPFGLQGSWQDDEGQPHHGGLTDLRRLWKELLGYPCPTLFHSFYGGQFAVSANAVRSRPRRLYAKARDLVHTKNEACAMERMWTFWFCHRDNRLD